LFRANRDAALEFVTRLADGKVQGASPLLLEEAASALAEYGSTEEIRGFLNPARTPQPPTEVLGPLMEGALDYGHRLALLPDLERFCRVDSPVRQVALDLLAQREPPEEVKRIWAGFLADKDPLRKAQAVNALGYIVDANVLLRLIKLLLPLLEDKDLGVRRAATWVVSRAANAEWLLQGKCYTLNELTTVNPLNVVAAPPDSPEEQELIKKVRDAAAKWLKDNDK
jgi:HEAT repeat protein